MIPNKKRFVLGTVQLGMQYGIHNSTGQPSGEAAISILRAAKDAGIEQVDSSDLYGTADSVIREANCGFRIHTKFVFGPDDLDFARALENSLSRLGTSRVESYSFHKVADFRRALAHYPSSFPEVTRAREQGKLGMAGVSVYSSQEALEALDCPWIDHIQMPMNLLDHGGIRAPVLSKIRETGKSLHVRSVFLQGLFHFEPERLPPEFQPLKPALDEMRKLAREVNLTLPELAMAYPLSVPEVAAIVVGLETRAQLDSNLKWLERLPRLDEAFRSRVEAVEVKAAELLSPVNWRKS